MDARTLTALEGSIAKWRAIVDGTGKDAGYRNCPLCTLFIEDEDPEESGRDCYGCPVSAKVGTDGCAGTPYEKWDAYLRDSGRLSHSDEAKVFDTVSAVLAKAELNFLLGLLPHNQPPAANSEGEKK